MSRHHQHILRRFDSAAESYEARASVQAVVADRLLDLLPAPRTVRRILEVGCGTGLLTRRLAARYPDAVLEALDHSPRMIGAARRQQPGVTWHVADLLSYRAATPYDLITSNCSLHWVEPLASGFLALRGLLAEGGALIFSIMLDGTLGELRAARLRAAPAKPPLGRLPTREEVRAAAAAAGWRVIQARRETLIEHHASADVFLKHIHALGLTGGAVSRAISPLARTELERVGREVEAQFRDGSRGVKATYVAGYISLAAAGARRPP